MTARCFASLEFESIGEIVPEQGQSGAYLEHMPQDRFDRAATTPLHAYGAGPFCRFKIARSCRDAGIYILTSDSISVYVGECVNLGKRWGPNGYGGISPRNCFVGGQSTNCRVNAAILAEAKAGRVIELFFRPFSGDKPDRVAAESSLILALRPAWNRAKLAW